MPPPLICDVADIVQIEGIGPTETSIGSRLGRLDAMTRRRSSFSRVNRDALRRVVDRVARAVVLVGHVGLVLSVALG
jgi:hypothetical protein